MKYCGECGFEIDDNFKVCPRCGKEQSFDYTEINYEAANTKEYGPTEGMGYNNGIAYLNKSNKDIYSILNVVINVNLIAAILFFLYDIIFSYMYLDFDMPFIHNMLFFECLTMGICSTAYCILTFKIKRYSKITVTLTVLMIMYIIWRACNGF